MLSETRRRTPYAPGRLGQLIRDHAVAMASDLGMFLLLPYLTKPDLRIGKQVAHSVHPRGMHAARLQMFHDPLRGLIRCPCANQLVESFLVFVAVRRYPESGVGQP